MYTGMERIHICNIEDGMPESASPKLKFSWERPLSSDKGEFSILCIRPVFP